MKLASPAPEAAPLLRAATTFGRGLRLVALAALLLPAATSRPARAADTPAKADQLVILSTTDVKGKTSPCGCHTPKGGLSRRAAFADSIRAAFGKVLLVDDGGFFPTDKEYLDAAPFLANAMVAMKVDAVGMGESELRFGASYLRALLGTSRLPVVCANLYDKATGKTFTEPYRIVQAGGVEVGVFGLMRNDVDLGPSKDSLRVEDPMAAAKRTVEELRGKGATVVVLLSQLGKDGTEDVPMKVDGIDAVIAGHNVPVFQIGRPFNKAMVCYGGEQGHYIGVTKLTLDPERRVASAENGTYMLGPDVRDKDDVAARVKTFEDALKQKVDKLEAAKKAETAGKAGAGGTSD